LYILHTYYFSFYVVKYNLYIVKHF